MLKICLALAAVAIAAFVLFPQLRFGLVGVLPFLPLVLCLLMCPLMMWMGMGGMGKDKTDDKKM